MARPGTASVAFALALFAGCVPNEIVGGDPADLDGGGPSIFEGCSGAQVGVDDNQNGQVDEGCGCIPGDVQGCWPAPIDLRGVGECRDGYQTCLGNDDDITSEWGPCIGAEMPEEDDVGNGVDEDCSGEDGPGGDCVPESCTDDIDNDCDGQADCGDIDCRSSEACDGCVTESCNDGVDNDCDGTVDCWDVDCASSEDCSGVDPPCVPEICTDDIDNDCDSLVDCGDPSCGSSEACSSEDPPCVPEVCTDDIDNDCDGKTDCSDFADCGLTLVCAFCWPESCTNHSDDDCDGVVDCEDTDCAGAEECCEETCPPGSMRWCDTPVACSWGQQTCAPDGSWGACIEVPPPPPCTGPYYDTDCCDSLPSACCQNFPDDGSIGECPGLETTCP